MNEMIPMNSEVGNVVREMMMPIIEPLCMMLKQNTEALERISATLNLQGKQIEALERQVRMNTPVTSVQAKYLNNAVREKAIESLARFDRTDKNARDALARRIRRDILVRGGISCMREVPKCEYDVVLKQIETWSNAVAIREIIRNIPKENS